MAAVCMGRGGVDPCCFDDDPGYRLSAANEPARLHATAKAGSGFPQDQPHDAELLPGRGRARHHAGLDHRHHGPSCVGPMTPYRLADAGTTLVAAAPYLLRVA